MYTKTTIVVNPSGNSLVHHNCNTVQVRDLILLLNQIILLVLRILHEIVLVAGTVAEPIAAAMDLVVVEHNVRPKHTAAEPSTSGYTEAAAQNMVVAVAVKNTSTVVVHTVVEVEVVPPEAVAMIDVLLDDLHPSHSMSHTSIIGVGHMSVNLYFHS